MNAREIAIESRAELYRNRLGGYLELTKPRVTSMVLVTTLAGFYLGAVGSFDISVALNLMVGTALASGGTLALNQYIERESDAFMKRTRYRPLPDGRLTPPEALWFGLLASASGLVYLLLTVNWLAAAVTASITAIYLLAYTPLKRVSWVCNLVGAIPGALPPVAGWAGARGSLSAEPWVLFGIMFLWQLPHSLSIAKLYRDDYERAGIRLLPEPRNGRALENPVIIAASIMLLAVGALPTLMGFAGTTYLVVAGVLGIAMLACGIVLVSGPETAAAARRVMFASLIYLPSVLLVMVLDKI
jgi:protoheme IX farnesyltransferase